MKALIRLVITLAVTLPSVTQAAGVTQAVGVTVPMFTVTKAAFLKSHNDVRAGLRLPLLRWNNTLAEFARAHTSKCVYKHSSGPYGENIYKSDPLNRNTTDLAVKSTASWRSESKRVDFPTWRCISATPSCGHYSQMVWGKTTQIGCAIAQCVSVAGVSPNLVVCEYSPGGNVVGQIPH
ncbi:uncharacterized protein LOC131951151 [Physella acuta]|uniref:uncharacterized protein LOC131951151 n=1 Tax=Physella acuta TaxID=109671 RepID=UPI0027DE2BEC|nr:uncharacterized protein LOC131951151 [Physella acuta]